MFRQVNSEYITGGVFSNRTDSGTCSRFKAVATIMVKVCDIVVMQAMKVDNYLFQKKRSDQFYQTDQLCVHKRQKAQVSQLAERKMQYDELEDCYILLVGN